MHTVALFEIVLRIEREFEENMAFGGLSSDCIGSGSGRCMSLWRMYLYSHYTAHSENRCFFSSSFFTRHKGNPGNDKGRLQVAVQDVV